MIDYNKDYRQEINSIYNKSKENSIHDNRLIKIFELFYEYCKIKKIEKVKPEEEGEYLYVLPDSINKAYKYYTPKNEESDDFFFYTLKVIKKDIKQAQSQANDNKESVIDIPETSKRQLEKAINQIKKFANSKGINIDKINDIELEMISKKIGFDVDKTKQLLTKWRTVKETEPLMLKQEDEFEEEIQNPGIKQTEDSPEKTMEKKEKKQQQQQKQKNYFLMINDVYMSLSPTKKNTYKVVLTNFFIDNMFDDNNDMEKVETTLKQFKFYDETDNRINQVTGDFIKTGKCKTQEELATIINRDKTYISKIQKNFKELFLKQVTLE